MVSASLVGEGRLVTPFDGLVLMGPPGSGKSFIGNALAARGIASYVELEPLLVAKFGQGDRFLANKRAALAFIRASYETQLASASKPVALESTGVSDRPLLEGLLERFTLALISVHTPKGVCLERVRDRPRHLNIGNDLAATAEFYDFWYREVEPSYPIASTIDGTDVERALHDIARILKGHARERRSDA